MWTAENVALHQRNTIHFKIYYNLKVFVNCDNCYSILN